MSSSFYSGSGLTNTEQDAIEGAKNAAEAARDAAQDAQTAAEAAETSAEAYSNAALVHRNTATTSAFQAQSFSNSALQFANSAEDSASDASTSASQSLNRANAAATSATNAATSEANAATSEANAATSATDAQTAQTAAEAAQTAAEAAQAAAEAALADFEGVYLGALASDPTVDANGDAVNEGDLYFNTTDNELLVYNGTAWVTSGITTVATSTDAGLMSSSDKSKLDGVEANATADQTASEIKTAYESNSDTNAFTDADHSKLDGIETGADVTDAANVEPLVDTHLNTSTAVSGEYLKWDGTDYDWASVPPGYTDSDVDTHLNTSGASNGQYLEWSGTDYQWSSVDLSTKMDVSGGTFTGEVVYEDRIDIDNNVFLGWGGGSGRPAIRADKGLNRIELWTGGNERVRIVNSGIYLRENGGNIIFEGSTPDNFETTLTVEDPTADRTITLPNASGTVPVISPNVFTSREVLTNFDETSINGVDINPSILTAQSHYWNITPGEFRVTSRVVTAAGFPTSYGDIKLSGDVYLGGLTSFNDDMSIYLNAPIATDLVFEGSTADNYETTLTVGDPTGDRTITLPDASGTVALEGADVSFNSVDADLSATVTNAKDIVPVTDGVYSLGTYSTHWGAVYADNIVAYTTAFLTDVTVNGEITFEGSTADANETVLTVTDPTADRTITLPDKTGTVAVYSADGTSGQVLTTDGSGNLSFTTVSGGGGSGDMSWQSAWPDDPDSNNCNIPIGDGSLAAVQSGGTCNVAIGKDALNDLTTGDFNTSLGYVAGARITTASSNTALGKNALGLSTTGAYNTAVGDQALYNNTSGSYKTAIGYQAGVSDSTDSYSTYVGANTFGTSYSTGGVAVGYSAQIGGNYEVAIGYDAGAGYTSNDYNTYVGAYAGNYNSSSKDYQTYIGYNAGNDATGDYTTALGSNAMTDGNHYASVAVGSFALNSSSTSSPYYNVAVGYSAHTNVYTGDGGVHVGYDADATSNADSYGIAVGFQARSTTYSVSMGYRAMNSAIDGSDNNVCIGYQAGFDLDGGLYNVFIGDQSGYNGGTGNYNTAVGRQTLHGLSSGTQNSAFGNFSLNDVTSGEYNTSIGAASGSILTTGSNNTFLGYNAGYFQDGQSTYALTTGSNVTCIGYQAVPSSGTATNEITLGDNDITSLRCNVQTISSLSDERDKTAIEDLPYGLDFINDMRPVQFTWNRRDGSLGATPDMGFIAQDLYDVELDHSSTSRTRLVKWDDPSKLEADYLRSYPILVKAVQQLSAKCDALEARIAELEGN